MPSQWNEKMSAHCDTNKEYMLKMEKIKLFPYSRMALHVPRK
jgi:hypothetical protein